MKIAVIKGSSIGDAILAVPLLRNLKQNYPDASVTLITEDSVSGLSVLKTCPYISEIVQIKKQTFARKISSFPRLLSLLLKKFDLVVVGMPVSKGKLKLAGMMRKNKLLYPDKSLYEPREKRIVDIDLEMLKASGLSVDDAHLELFFDAETMKKLGEAVKVKNCIAIYVGRDTDVYRKWPANQWIELLSQLKKKYSISVIGAHDCKETARIIAENTRAENMAGKMSLEDTAVFLKSSALMITTNGGPMHLAAALGVPLVLVNTSSSKMWYPQAKARVLHGSCKSPCRNDWCIFAENDSRHAQCQKISAKDVAEAVKAMLKT